VRYCSAPVTDPAQPIASEGASRRGRRNPWLIALGALVFVVAALRACVCEPFKMPSSSMMPTMHHGDHFFTSKLAYGLGLGEPSVPARGDVVVFRYPLKESEDFVKRVIGGPGDVVQLQGRSVSIRRAGADDFEELTRVELTDSCLDESATRPVAGCTMYSETLDGQTYRVQYMRADEGGLLPGIQTFEVPAGHIFVLGDNRNRSHDSAAWVDAQENPRPYVPLRNLKGRVERIWLPFSRFWTPVR